MVVLVRVKSMRGWGMNILMVMPILMGGRIIFMVEIIMGKLSMMYTWGIMAIMKNNHHCIYCMEVPILIIHQILHPIIWHTQTIMLHPIHLHSMLFHHHHYFIMIKMQIVILISLQNNRFRHFNGPWIGHKLIWKRK